MLRLSGPKECFVFINVLVSMIRYLQSTDRMAPDHFFCSLFTELVCILQTAQASFHGTWRHKFSKYKSTFG